MKTTDEDKKLIESKNIPITGRFDQYRSSYWGAALAAFGIRYPFREMMRGGWTAEASLASKHTYSAVVGTIMESVTGFFAYRTFKDIKSIYSQAVAWDTGKDKKDLTFSDFMKSDNSMVQETMSNFVSYTERRGGINSIFFMPLIVGPMVKKSNIIDINGKWKNLHPDKWSPQIGEGLGLGILALYLLRDVISRKKTSFESLQYTVDDKINHAERAGERMDALDLLDIYERHANNGKIKTFNEHRGTPEWAHSMAIFNRMAELMNQTYGNVARTEKGDLEMSHFIYMVGHNLIQPNKLEQSLLFIEVFNKNGIDALKEAVKEVGEGASVSDLAKKYSVTLPVMAVAAAANNYEEPKTVVKKFSEDVVKSQNGYASMAAVPEKTADSFVGRIKESQIGPVLPN